MPEIKQRKFLRKTKKLGNSCGVLLPKYLLGADVRILVVSPPMNIEKDVPKILSGFLKDIIGIYLISKTEKTAEILAISTNIREQIKKGKYKIDIVPLSVIKSSLKLKQTVEKIKLAKPIINKKLLAELQKEI
ncbi:MAG: hypothetical protein U9Q06_03005 [Nanoarchaeota archaeon]|nr:hypothetical protein [Nanoarchaeota archaeon]